jgi:hypothetical protein
MPITPYLDGISFDHETKRVMGVAFEMARTALRRSDSGDPVVAIVARKIIALAKDGEINPDLLCDKALMGLQLRKLSAAGNGASLADLLEVLVHSAIDLTGGKARAAFYRANANESELHHITGMPQAYARHVDGFAISGQSLACGLAAFKRQPIITPDVIAEPRWKPWLWLAKEFDYRACWSFPIETSAGKLFGTFAMYYKDPTEATPPDLDLTSTLTRAASTIIHDVGANRDEADRLIHPPLRRRGGFEVAR